MRDVPGHRLTPRDRDILACIHKFDQLDRQQIQERFFGTTLGARKQANKRLKFLTDAGYLHRAKQILVEGDGDRPRLYTLTIEATHELGGTKRTRALERGGSVSEHRRFLNSLLLRVESSARPGWTVITHAEPLLKDELHGRDVPFPDGRFYLSTGAGSANGGLIEADRGTESKAKIALKIQNYVRAARSGALQKAHGTDKIRVFIVTRARTAPLTFRSSPEDSDRRVAELLRYITQATTTMRGLFWVTSEDDFFAGSPLVRPIWRTVGSSDLQAVID